MLRCRCWRAACGFGRARAADPYTFALVPKSTNNPFYDQALAGCKKAEAELKGAIKCLYIGPNEHGGGDEQAQIVGDLITKKVDGIAVSPANAAAIAAALQGAKAANIPIITWDSDLLDKDKGLRLTYIGTHNYDIGVNLAKLVMQVKPKGGTICIQSGGAAAANHNERMQGVRDTLAGKKSAEAPACGSPARMAGPKSPAVRNTPTTTSRSRCRWSRISSTRIRSSTPSSRPEASASSWSTPTRTRWPNSRTGSRRARSP